VQHSRLPFEKAWRPPSVENAVNAANRSGYLVQPSPAEDASHASPGKAIPQTTTKSPPSDSTFTRFRIPCPSSIAYFSARFRRFQGFTNQPLAASCRPLPRHTKAQPWYTQSALVTFLAQAWRARLEAEFVTLLLESSDEHETYLYRSLPARS